MGETLAQIKRRYFLDALDKHEKVYLHFVTSVDGVLMPHHLYEQEVVVFVYGYDLPIPIADFEVDEEGVGATLSFGGSPYYCFVPWKAVLMISTNTGEVWPVPEEEYVDVLLDYLMERLKESGHMPSVRHLDEARQRWEERQAPHLKVVEEGDGSEADGGSPDPGDDSPKGPPTLKIIS